jgi:hypothetical protein
MADESLCPCKKCGHPRSDHGRYFDYCYACKDMRISSYCQFERIDNLKYLEWISTQKERNDEPR